MAIAEFSRGAVVGRAPSNGFELLRELPGPLASLRGTAESAVATQDCSVPGISSRDVAKWEPIPVALSAEEAIHWFKALQMLRRCDGSSITTKRTK